MNIKGAVIAYQKVLSLHLLGKIKQANKKTSDRISSNQFKISTGYLLKTSAVI
jgi:hypothetical protein